MERALLHSVDGEIAARIREGRSPVAAALAERLGLPPKAAG